MAKNKNSDNKSTTATNAASQNSGDVVSVPNTETYDQVGNANQAAQTGVPANLEEVQAGGRQQSYWTMVKGFFFRMLIIYFISSMFSKGKAPVQPQNASSGELMKKGGSYAPGTNLYRTGTFLDFYVYLADNDNVHGVKDFEAPIWTKKNVKYGDWQSGENKDGSYNMFYEFPTPTALLNNGSLYMHVYFVPMGQSPNPSSPEYSQKYTFHSIKKLSKHKRRKISNTVNLLTGQTDGPRLTEEDRKFHKMVEGEKEAEPGAGAVAQKKEENTAISGNSNSRYLTLPPMPHWHPNITLNLLDDHTAWIQGSVPVPLNDYIQFYENTNEYYPVIFINDYWNLHEDYYPVNDSVKTLNISITFSHISLFKWQIYTAQSARNKWYGNILGADMVQESDEEQDTLKKTLIETNPYLLALTVVVSLVHSVFEILAFKNDIQFWKSRESLEGLSVRSVFFNVFQSLIVVLYVWDNDTNFMVKMSVIVGMFIELWKIKKVVNVKIDFENRLLGIIPISFEDKSSYVESDTRKYDRLAFRYLSWLLYPLIVGYAVYSLFYQEHRSWYSWVLSMMYGFLLTFGFIMMTPQLFINYKLKSIAHLPWRMLTYKALNTFIDDIFAFVIKMPTLYRIGCLRDDVIFFIFLYQRWIYPIDPSRVNEFGVSQEMLEKRGDVKEEVSDGDQLTAGNSIDSKPEDNTNSIDESKKDK